jgi:hypothetical protein
MKQLNCDAAYWHFSDMPGQPTMSALEGKGDMPFNRGHFRF